MGHRSRTAVCAARAATAIAIAFAARIPTQADPTPFDDAVAVWHMADPSDAAGADSRLTPSGAVRLGVALEGAERAASLARGGDGLVAAFEGGYLSAGQGAGGELNLTGKAMSLCIRLRDPSGRWDAPLFSKHGGHERLVYNLFSADLGHGRIIGFELGTDFGPRMLQLTVPVAAIGPDRWHDCIVRYAGARVELFIDGVLVDEEWPIGRLRRGNPEPCLIGAESYNGVAKSGFRGLVDHAALWARALSDDEIAALSGGRDRIPAREAEILGPEPASLQYARPRGHDANAGDCMPFFHDGVFHLFYLFDRRHHGSKYGLGAHQWAHATTRDLIRWTHHPLALAIDEEWEGSICTGSVFPHEGKYYAFYATRKPDRTQHLGVAVSSDGVRFEKTKPNPFASPGAGYNPLAFRDPTVFRDERTGRFHLLVTASLTDGRGGCLAQLVSKDLANWTPADPFIVTGFVPECPDHFRWNDWYYLISTRYRMARDPLGPWTAPKGNALDVMPVPKTAAFPGGRRIYVSWLADGGWGGDIVFRELVQEPDGRLGTAFVPEMIPRCGRTNVLGDARRVRLDARDGPAGAVLEGIPNDARIVLQARPEAGVSRYGACVRASADPGSGCELRIEPARERIGLGDPGAGSDGPDPRCALEGVDRLDRGGRIEIILKGPIVDVSIAGRRTIIRRCPGLRGDRLVLLARGGTVVFEDLEVRPIVE
ncbi:MAG: glycosyl hydrolase [Planctomycetes bacterium]|nr:glycosyl hydrolase [Planctomycetota bacterium]